VTGKQIVELMYRAIANAEYQRKLPVRFVMGYRTWKTLARHEAFWAPKPPPDLKIWGVPTTVTDDGAGFGLVVK
jgi:hypothetical protein